MSGQRKVVKVRDWFKSSHSSGNGACVEVQILPDSVGVHHSKDHRNYIYFTLPEWEAFLAGVKDGEFDLEQV